MSSLPTLPPIRTDIAAAKADLDEFGLTRFQGALTDSEVRQVRTRLLEQAAGEAAQGIAFNDPARRRSAISMGRTSGSST